MKERIGESVMGEDWTYKLSKEEWRRYDSLNEWVKRPLDALIEDAIKAPSGVAWDRIRVEEGPTLAILIAVHPKAEPWATMTRHYFEECRRNERDSVRGAGYLYVVEEAFKLAPSGISAVLVLGNPDVVLISSVVPDQIKRLETDYLT